MKVRQVKARKKEGQAAGFRAARWRHQSSSAAFNPIALFSRSTEKDYPQAKLKIGSPGDIYEKEADQISEQVMNMPEPVAQRQPVEEEEPIQAKPLAEQITPLVQKQPEEEEESLQEKSLLQRQAEEEEGALQGTFTTSETSAQLQGDAGEAENRNGMPRPLKAGLEALSGMDLSGIRVHTNSSKPAQINALAYTQGQDIHVGPGQEKHLPHEGWHAVQQMQGRVKPTMQAKGVSINDDAGLEREAYVMGTKALQMMQGEQATTGLDKKAALSSLNSASVGLTTIQRKGGSSSVITYTEKSTEKVDGSEPMVVKAPDNTYHNVVVKYSFDKVTYSAAKKTIYDGGTSVGNALKAGGKVVMGGGVITAGVGGTIMLWGLATGPAVPLSELAGATTAAVGGAIAAIGGAVSGIGSAINWLFGDEPTVKVENLPDRVEWKNLKWGTMEVKGIASNPSKVSGTINEELNLIKFTPPFKDSGVMKP